jgi:hypothetical protein
MHRRKTHRLPAACGALLLSLGLSQGASAQTVIDFNDLGASTSGTHMPDTYGGLNWKATNWHSMTTEAAAGDPFLALSGSLTTIRRSDGAAFHFDGADFWSRRGLDANGNLYFVLSLKGKVVYNGVTAKGGKVRFNDTHQLLKPAYTGLVDTVAVAFNKAGKGGDWDQLAMDNFRIRP